MRGLARLQGHEPERGDPDNHTSRGGWGIAIDPATMIAHALPNGMTVNPTAAHDALHWTSRKFSFHEAKADSIIQAQGIEVGKAD